MVGMRSNLLPGWSFFALLLTLPVGMAARGQSYTGEEVAVGGLSQTTSAYDDAANFVGARHIFAGPLGRTTFNLSPSLAVEGSVGYLPGYQTGGSTDVGHELLAVGGVKAGWRGRRFGIFGKAEPGIASWTPGLIVYRFNTADPQNYQILDERRTDFTLDLGGAFEWYPTRRTVVRLDVSQTLLAEYDQVLDRFIFTNGEEEYIVPGHIAQHLGLMLTVGHRLGRLREETETVPRRDPVDMGVLFSLQQRVHEDGAGQILPNRGGGAWADWNFSKYVGLDGTAFYSPQDDKHDFPQDGGRDTMVLGGLKAGLRRGRMGYFATARPGFLQMSRTESFIDVYGTPRGLVADVRWRKTTDYAQMLGGLVEVYLGKHWEMRADVGNAFIHYHGATVEYWDSPRVPLTPLQGYDPPFRRASLVTLFGMGWRF